MMGNPMQDVVDGLGQSPGEMVHKYQNQIMAGCGYRTVLVLATFEKALENNINYSLNLKTWFGLSACSEGL